jgi:hypothetical protein
MIVKLSCTSHGIRTFCPVGIQSLGFKSVGAMTLSIMTLSIRALSIKTLSIKTLSMNNTQHSNNRPLCGVLLFIYYCAGWRYADCRYAECCGDNSVSWD